MFNNKQPIRHAYYKEYRELQKLCLTILQQHKHYIGSNAEKIHGIIFDGAWLWEEYIDTLIHEDFTILKIKVVVELKDYLVHKWVPK